jgi:undecaprenyl diphosphate synthase
MEAIRNRDEALAPPGHVAIIMDGNGRWARNRNLPRVAGHERGAEAVRRTVHGCLDIGIKYLTLYAFSSENWKRPEAEVDDLMALLRVYLRHEIADLHKKGVQVRFIGRRGPLAADIKDLIEVAEQLTAGNGGLVLVIALNYGGRDEIVRAARLLAREVAAGRLGTEDITDELFARHLETAGIPNPDLLVRTSGEQRLSNFLLWQAAYTELVFTDVCWPDFTKEHLEMAIREYQQRERRFGATHG